MKITVQKWLAWMICSLAVGLLPSACFVEWAKAMVAATDQYITLEVTDFDPNDIIWNGEMTYTAILATPDWQCPNHGPMDPYSTATITFGGEKTPYCHYCVFETALEVLKEHGLTPLEPYRKPIDNRK